MQIDNLIKSLPRICGDGPYQGHAGESCQEFTPHMRGWTPEESFGISIDSVYPAYAGMDLGGYDLVLHNWSLPRICGDGPESGLLPSRGQEFTPHMRGWTYEPSCIFCGEPVYPAYAGMDLSGYDLVLHNWSLPRICGDGPAGDGVCHRRRQFTPHTRGCFLCVVREKKQISPLPEQGISSIRI